MLLESDIAIQAQVFWFLASALLGAVAVILHKRRLFCWYGTLTIVMYTL
jgi:hypothetical protein